MAERTRAQSSGDPGGEPLTITAREAVELAREYITEITDRQPANMTLLAPTDVGGWLVEVEVVEDRRIPSSSDILGLYEVELDPNGELLSYRRTSRYLRSQAVNGGG